MSTTRLFVTEIYKATLDNARELNADIEQTTKMLAKEDKAGRAWCKENGYKATRPTLRSTICRSAPPASIR